MSQETPTVTDTLSTETDSSHEAGEEVALVQEAPEEVDAGPGASESGFAVRFGSGFAIGMLAGGIVGILLNSMALAMFGGFILGSVVGVVLAARD
jgi:F0F1-type ATP synthase assembly protein I